MACFDRYSLLLSTNSELAAERYRIGVDMLLSLWPGADEAIDEAIDADPEFALALAARARLHAIRAEIGDARAKITKAAARVVRSGTPRERSHVEALSLAIHGHATKALAAALEHVDRWPRDVLVLSLPLGAFGLFAFSGMANHDQARVDLCERHARHFEADDWWFLSSRGWAHGENGNVRLGRTLAQRALELRRHNANAAHAVAHVLHEAGANDEANAMIANWLPEYNRSGILHGHIAWHAALIALERGDTGRALEIYDTHVAPAASRGVPINVVSDTASFLWRMQAYGHTVPDGKWDDAARYASHFFRRPGLPFADVHMALIAAATRATAVLNERAGALDALVEAGKLPAGAAVPTICRAALAFAEEKYAQCAALLEPVMHEAVRIGGSGAQREIVQDTLIVAWMRSGDTGKARALLNQRLHRRPSPRDTRWLVDILCAQKDEGSGGAQAGMG